MKPPRSYERDTDRLFIYALRRDPAIGAPFLNAVHLCEVWVGHDNGQSRHVGRTDTIEIDVAFADGPRLMIENKINIK